MEKMTSVDANPAGRKHAPGHTSSQLRVAWLAPGIVLLVGVHATAQKPTPEIQRIFADWHKRQSVMRSVRYEVQGQRVFPRGSFSDPLTGRALKPLSPPHDITGDAGFTAVIDFAAGRYRFQESTPFYNQNKKQLIQRVAISIFDGAQRVSALPREANSRWLSTKHGPPNADVALISGNPRAGVIAADYWPLFFGHGVVPTMMDGIVPGVRMSRIPDAELLYLHGLSRYKDRNCLILRTHPLRMGTTSLDEYWVDPERDSAVLRYISYVNGSTWIDLEVDYQKSAYGWLASKWTYTHRVEKGKTESIYRMHVVSMTAEPVIGEDTFKVEIRPGMVVEKGTMGGSPDSPIVNPVRDPDFYRVRDDGSLRLLEYRLPGSGVRHAASHFWWWIAGLVTLALVSAGWWFRRVRRRGASV